MLGIYGVHTPSPLPINTSNMSTSGTSKLHKNQSPATNPIEKLLRGLLGQQRAN